MRISYNEYIIHLSNNTTSASWKNLGGDSAGVWTSRCWHRVPAAERFHERPQSVGAQISREAPVAERELKRDSRRQRQRQVGEGPNRWPRKTTRKHRPRRHSRV